MSGRTGGRGIGDGAPDTEPWAGATYRVDNCPGVANPDKADSDGDGRGDACSGATNRFFAGYQTVRPGQTLTPTSIIGAFGSFRVPTVTCPADVTATTGVNQWVGTGAAAGDMVFRGGAQAYCNGPSASYRFWYQSGGAVTSGSPTYVTEFTPKPGDYVYVAINPQGGIRTSTITIEDLGPTPAAGTGAMPYARTFTVDPSPLGFARSAECITELPPNAVGLANFGTASFAPVPNQPALPSCSLQAGNGAMVPVAAGASGAGSTSSRISMVNRASAVLATPGAAAGDGSFTVAWKASN